MVAPVSKHRLSSSAFTRIDEEQKIDPKKVIYLSVEGDETERNYFEHLNTCMENALVRIEVLRHKHGDGYSDPEDVIELLTEYIHVRNGELIPDDCLITLSQKFSQQELQLYLDDPHSLPSEKKTLIQEGLFLAGIDLDYRKYLRSIDPNEDDIFAVVIDRDCGNHSRDLMQKCWQRCSTDHLGCFISNPCFEFWLLLHLCNVKNNYTEEQLKEFLENKKVSAHHTKTSSEVSKLAHHRKSISANKFRSCYYPRISEAIANAKSFANNYPEILDNLGTNLPQLFEQMGFFTDVKNEVVE